MYVYNFTVNQNIVFYLFNNLVFASYYHHLMFGNFFFYCGKANLPSHSLIQSKLKKVLETGCLLIRPKNFNFFTLSPYKIYYIIAIWYKQTAVPLTNKLMLPIYLQQLYLTSPLICKLHFFSYS